MSLCAAEVHGWMSRYGAQPQRFGPAAATVAQAVKVDNDLYVRDYSRCILCYKCVEACGVDAQNTFAIGVAGGGVVAPNSPEVQTPPPGAPPLDLRQFIRGWPPRARIFESEVEPDPAGPLGGAPPSRTEAR